MTQKPQLKAEITANVRAALREDVGTGDLTAALVPAEQQATARLITREEAVICGTDWFNEVFAQLDAGIAIDWRVVDGERVDADALLCRLSGPARALLTGERTAMNFLQTLSGTATAARAYCAAIENTDTVVLDTRKTLPGLRLAQKYAIRTGGAQNHRIGLFDGILIKENHIVACGGIGAAVAAALEQTQHNPDIIVEVEVESLEEVRAALNAGASRLLLDNFSLAEMREADALRNQLGSQAGLEASGNVTLETIQTIAATGVDYISIGALTKDVRAIDLSMRFEML